MPPCNSPKILPNRKFFFLLQHNKTKQKKKDTHKLHPWNSAAGCPSNVMSVRRGELQSWSFAIWLYRGKEVGKNRPVFFLLVCLKKKRFLFCMRLIMLLTFCWDVYYFSLIYCTIHCQLPNKAYEKWNPWRPYSSPREQSILCSFFVVWNTGKAFYRVQSN